MTVPKFLLARIVMFVFHVGENGRLDEVALVANAIPTDDYLGVSSFFPDVDVAHPLSNWS